MNSHLCVMIGASVALSQSQHISVSHYLPVWLRTECFLTAIKSHAYTRAQRMGRTNFLVTDDLVEFEERPIEPRENCASFERNLEIKPQTNKEKPKDGNM